MRKTFAAGRRDLPDRMSLIMSQLVGGEASLESQEKQAFVQEQKTPCSATAMQPGGYS